MKGFMACIFDSITDCIYSYTNVIITNAAEFSIISVCFAIQIIFEPVMIKRVYTK